MKLLKGLGHSSKKDKTSTPTVKAARTTTNSNSNPSTPSQSQHHLHHPHMAINQNHQLNHSQQHMNHRTPSTPSSSSSPLVMTRNPPSANPVSRQRIRSARGDMELSAVTLSELDAVDPLMNNQTDLSFLQHNDATTCSTMIDIVQSSSSPLALKSPSLQTRTQTVSAISGDDAHARSSAAKRSLPQVPLRSPHHLQHMARSTPHNTNQFISNLKESFPNYDLYLDSSVNGSSPLMNHSGSGSVMTPKNSNSSSSRSRRNAAIESTAKSHRSRHDHGTPNGRSVSNKTPLISDNSSSMASTPSSIVQTPPKDDSVLMSLDDVQLDYVATPVNQPKKLVFPELDNERINSQLKQFCQKQSAEIDALQKKIQKLKKFKHRMKKCQNLADILYKKAAELMCEGWMSRNKDDDAHDKEHRTQFFNRGLDFLKAAALLNHAQAQFEYAEFLIQHYKMVEDSSQLQEAIHYLNKAQLNGHVKAGVFLSKMRQYMAPQQQKRTESPMKQ